MKNNYQTNTTRAVTREVVMPDRVSVAMAELAGTMREGLLALAVGAGLQVMQALMDESVTALAGPRGLHNPDRTAVRHGDEAGSVTLGGRRVAVRRPRVRTADRAAEIAVPAYELFNSTELLGELALEKMMAKLSTRRYAAGLEPVGSTVTEAASSTSRSAVSRRFVAMTERALDEMMCSDLSTLELVALMIDGVHFANHLCVVALGISIDGTKIPLAVVEGDTENTTVVKDLLVNLRERGLDMTRPILCVLDGAKALAAGVNAVFDRPLIQRCQLHKIRNVQAKLPKTLASTVATKMRAAYHDRDALQAEATLEALARSLDKAHPGAAGSLREGLAETLTVSRLGVPNTRAVVTVDERDRVDDRDLSRPLLERETLAGRHHGIALVRRRHARSREAVPTRQRSPAPRRTTRRARQALRTRRHTGMRR
jgi:putative transposase